MPDIDLSELRAAVKLLPKIEDNEMPGVAYKIRHANWDEECRYAAVIIAARRLVEAREESE